MKKLIIPVLALFVLAPVSASFAQAPDSVPPGPTIQQRPGLTNNNLPNPNSADEQTAQPLNTQTSAPAPTTSTMDPVDTTTPADTMDTTVDTDTTLPATGSKLPLVGLIGLLSLAGALIARRF